VFLSSFLGVLCGYLCGTVLLLLYTHLRDRWRHRENEKYKQKLIDILQEPPSEADQMRIVRRAGVPRTEN
jgi:hypothetical protein